MNGDDASRNGSENFPSVKVGNELSTEEQAGQEMDQKDLKSPDKASGNVQEMKLPPKGRQVLPNPSPEQRDIIRAVGEGKCVTIRACAGSGKTTCMLQVAASFHQAWRLPRAWLGLLRCSILYIARRVGLPKRHLRSLPQLP